LWVVSNPARLDRQRQEPDPEGGTLMRVMVLIKATEQSEAGQLPS
jgi:hypothetical protein